MMANKINYRDENPIQYSFFNQCIISRFPSTRHCHSKHTCDSKIILICVQILQQYPAGMYLSSLTHRVSLATFRYIDISELRNAAKTECNIFKLDYMDPSTNSFQKYTNPNLTLVSLFNQSRIDNDLDKHCA